MTDGAEARAWFSGGGTLASDGFESYHGPEFVEALYAAGATLVVVKDNTLVATLPESPEARAAVIAMYNAEFDRFDEDFGGEDGRGHAMTREEAIELGHPEAEGEWVVDDFHVEDTGQSTITFWWD